MAQTRGVGPGVAPGVAAGAAPGRAGWRSSPRPMRRGLSIVGGLALAACAIKPAPQPPAPSPPPEAAPVSRVAQGRQVDDPVNRCASMIHRALPGLAVERAELVAEGQVHAVQGAERRPVGDPLPEHCRVEGRIDAAGDLAGVTAATGFEMRMPTRWNGRFFHQGSHDVVAHRAEAFGRNTGAAGLEANALGRGFAVLASDAGRLLASAAAGMEPLGGSPAEALARAAAAGQALARVYYGKLPDRSYFVGCSAGGREGLLLAQRWPALFDGIVAVAPLLRETDAALAAAWALQRIGAASPRSRERRAAASQAFGAEDLFTVAQAVLAQCDALDGAEDGFVMDMAACRVDLVPLTCRRGSPKACLSERQVQALGEALAGPRDAAGRPLYVHWPWDPGIAAPGWRAWMLGSAGPGGTVAARHATHTTAALGAQFGAPPGMALLATRLDAGGELRRLQEARDADAALFDDALAGFRGRQGRLLLMHGAADPVVSAWATVEYQQRLDRASAGVAAAGGPDFARSFVVPGMNHCAGGPATDRFDGLAAIVDWVEHGRAPQRIEARGSAVLQGETRPLCPWPQVARYRGHGSVHDSASHECR